MFWFLTQIDDFDELHAFAVKEFDEQHFDDEEAEDHEFLENCSNSLCDC